MDKEQPRPYFDREAAKRGHILLVALSVVAALPKGVIRFGVATIARPSDESMRAVEKLKQGK